MDYNSIAKDIKAGKHSPVYLLQGEEPYYIQSLLELFETSIIEESQRDFNQSLFYGSEVTTDQVVNQAKTYPMMGEKQLIIIKEMQEMDLVKRAGDYPSFTHYLENPMQSTVLVLAHMHKSMDKRRAGWKALSKSKHVVIFDSEKIKDFEVPRWIEKYAASAGLKVDPETAYLLSEYLGNNLSKIANEMDKLAVSLPKDSVVDAEVVQKYIGISKDYNIFELQKALGNKDIVKANRIINYFAANPKDNSIHMLLPMLYSFFTKVLMVHYCGPAELGSKLRVPRQAIPEYRAAASKFSIPKIQRIIGYLRDSDRIAKGTEYSSFSEESLLRELIFKILH